MTGNRQVCWALCNKASRG